MDALDRVVEVLLGTLEAERFIYVMGNGGSAANAEHFVNDFGKVEARGAAPELRGAGRRGGPSRKHLDVWEFAHHDAFMRTTLTLDPDVARMVAEEVHRRRRPFKQVVNDALRRGLTPRAGRPRSGRYRVRPVAATLLPGIDRGKLNALADEHEDRALVARLLQTRRAR